MAAAYVEHGHPTSGTTAQRPTNVEIGFHYFDTTTTEWIVWNGTSWQQAGDAPSSDITAASITGSDASLAITGAAAATATAAGGAIPIAGGAGGATSGAGGATSLSGGAATAGNSAGGASSLVGGAGSGSAAGGAVAATGGAGGATGAGGAAAVAGGAGGATSGTGGAASLTGGAATAGNSAGGTAALAGGAGQGTGNGGAASVTGGASGAGATGNGGAVSLTGGAASSTDGNGGNVNLVGGAGAGTGTDGEVQINGNSNLVFTTYKFTGTPAADDQAFFLATRAMRIKSISCVFSVAAGGASKLQVTKDTGTTAPGGGTDLLTNNTNTGFDLNATANTVQTGTLTETAADLELAAGDRLSVDFADAIQSSAGVLVTVGMVPI